MTVDGTEIGLFDAIHTQRAIRSLRAEEVPREVIEQIVESATRAPSGGNSQPWAFVIVRDRATMSALAGHARVGFAAMYERAMERRGPDDPVPYPRLKPMIEAFEVLPALIVVCGVGPPGRVVEPWPLAASIFPAVQNLLLAARGLGIGAALTTGWAGPRRAEIAELLRLPAHVIPLAFVPIGYPDRERYGPTTRRPLSEVLHWDTYVEPANTAAVAHR